MATPAWIPPCKRQPTAVAVTHVCAFRLQIMNMKPAEILSLLEEASGTKLYERKKDAALKVLAKKQTKLDEIDQVWAALL